jgi:SSS family solute:Na+ symporter
VILGAFSAQFTWVDWLVVAAYLGFTTWLGARMAGKQASIRDFFLGGRKLPWPAVSGSIIATEISALTFVSVPWVVFQPGGNLTYLQLGVFGSLCARILVGYILVPAYYKREIYSPYDYMHNQLGGHVRGLTTGLFMLGGLLGQSARIYLTAEVINVVLHDQLVELSRALGLNELAWAIILIAGVSVVWTLIGGMSTVIWTDVVLFLAFLVGALTALAVVMFSLDGGLVEMFRTGWAARESGVWGKFTFFDFSASPVRNYTIWTAIIASTWGGLGAYGTDQLMAQRMFCCRGPREARRAIIASAASQIVTTIVALVGVGLYAYYQDHPLQGEALNLFAARGDRIFPIFVVQVIPRGLKGLIIAAIFAAAISSVMGILTALSQTAQTAFYEPARRLWLRGREERVAAGRVRSSRQQLAGSGAGATAVTLALDATSPPSRSPTDQIDNAGGQSSVLASRALVLFWGIALGLLAYSVQDVADKYRSILDMGLAMAGYVSGALLAGFLLSFLPLRVDSRGLVHAAPLSCMCVFALIWHTKWSHWVCWIAAAAIVAGWLMQLYADRRPPPGSGKSARLVLPAPLQTVILLAGLELMLWLNYFGYWHDPAGAVSYQTVAWPWMIPLGSSVAFVWGYLLAQFRSSRALP